MRIFSSLVALSLILSFAPAQAQITITYLDMPNSGDTLRYSNGNPATNLDLNNTGPNTAWDYTNLTMVTQGVATYKKASQINSSYGLFFGSSGYGLRVIDTIGSGQFQIKDVYDFYNKTQASFNAKGRGLTAFSFPIPSFYGDQDEIYQFPLTYGRIDTSTFEVVFSLLTYGSFTQTGTRINTVDGWGTLKTAYGTFDVIRVKSEVFEQDSIGSDQLPSGLKFDNNSVQYKWLAKGQHLPILEVDGNSIAGNFVPTMVKYRDSLRTSPLAPEVDFTVNNQVGTTHDTFSFSNNTNGVGNSYNWTFTPNNVKFINGSSSTSTNPSVQFSQSGLYTVKLDATNFAGNGTETKTSYVNVSYPTGVLEQSIDANSFFAFSTGDHLVYSYDLKDNATVSLSLYSADGRLEKIQPTENLTIGRQAGTFDIAALPTGIHFLVLQVNGVATTAKFIKQ